MKKYIILTAIFFMSFMSSSIANQINIIDNANNLFESGALSKEEFEKAKKKILD